jgi:hypothetical protein
MMATMKSFGSEENQVVKGTLETGYALHAVDVNSMRIDFTDLGRT